jgi:O-antigen ligase
MSVSALIVGLAAALVVAVPVLLSFKRRSIYIYFFAVISAFILLLIFIKNHSIGNGFFYELHEILNGRISDKFGSNRIRIWREVISVIPERLFLGKGADSMVYERFEHFSTYYPALNKTLTTSIDVAHNEYLNVLYHQGLLGLCSYLAILFLTFTKFTKNPSALGVAAVAYSVQAFFGFSMCLTAPYFWVIIALIHIQSIKKHLP